MISTNPNTGEVIIDRGDDQTIRFTVTDVAGAVKDVSAGTFTFTVKASFDDAIGAALFQRTSPAGNGIDLTLAATGIVDVNLVAANTTSLAGRYVYDLQMVLAGNTRTLRTGAFIVRKEVTH